MTGPRIELYLRSKKRLGKNIFAFHFQPEKSLPFIAGQYLDWHLPHTKIDPRGDHRFFTIASSPTEKDILLVTSFARPGSSFKKALLNLKPGDKIIVGQPAGDFTLGQNPTEKYVFIAGGIGITPFRSIIKHLLDTNHRHPITLLHLTKNKNEAIFKSLFDQAEKKIGLKTASLYSLSKLERAIKRVPHFKKSSFYISGSDSFVRSVVETLIRLKIPKTQIFQDYFPGY